VHVKRRLRRILDGIAHGIIARIGNPWISRIRIRVGWSDIGQFGAGVVGGGRTDFLSDAVHKRCGR
jgi:hypothetical protein